MLKKLYLINLDPKINVFTHENTRNDFKLIRNCKNRYE